MLDDAVQDPFALRRVIIEHGSGPQGRSRLGHDCGHDLFVLREEGIVAAIAHRLFAHEDPASRSQRLRPRRERGTWIAQVPEQEPRVDHVRREAAAAA